MVRSGSAKTMHFRGKWNDIGIIELSQKSLPSNELTDHAIRTAKPAPNARVPLFLQVRAYVIGHFFQVAPSHFLRLAVGVAQNETFNAALHDAPVMSLGAHDD